MMPAGPRWFSIAFHGLLTSGLFAPSPTVVQGQPRRISWPSAPALDTLPHLITGPPQVVFGTAFGPPATLLSGVIGAVGLAHDAIAIGEVGGHRIIFASTTSGTSSIIGRSGDGPGEFRLPIWLGRCGRDTVGMYDVPHHSITLATVAGFTGTRIEVPAAIEFDRLLHCRTDGELLFLGNRPRVYLEPGATTTAPVRLLRVSPSGIIDTLAPLGGQEYYAARNVGAFIDLPLGHSVVAVAGRRLTYFAETVSGTVEVVRPDGALVERFTVSLPMRPVSARDWQQVLANRLDAHPFAQTRAIIKQVLDEVPPPSRFPPIADVRVDQLDRLWVRTFAGYGGKDAVWLVVLPSGRPVALVAVPANLTIQEIGDHLILGILRDPNGVEQIATLPTPRIP